MLLGIANSVNRDTERKRVLTAANSDFLMLDIEEVINDGQSFDIAIKLHQIGVTQFIVSSSDYTQYIFVNPNGACIYVSGVGNTSTANEACIVGDNIITLSRSAGAMQVSANGVFSGSPTLPTFSVSNISRRSTDFSTVDVFNFTLNNKTANLNEGNGLNVYYEDGTLAATFETSALDPLNYNNLEVIKPI
jgi:hypothetical protein